MSTFDVQDIENQPTGAVQRQTRHLRNKRGEPLQITKTQNDDQKRPVLGVINGNGVRVQPPRATKQNVAKKDNKIIQDENLFVVPRKPGLVQSQKLPFSIHVDTDNKDTQTAKGTCIVPVVKPVPVEQHKPALANVFEAISIDQDTEPSPFKNDSPMVLDTTLEEPRQRTAKESENDIFDVKEYFHDIYSYLRDMEDKHKPKCNYMKKQPDITYSMRSILVDWLVEVGEEYKLQTETLYLAASYIDRFLSCMSVLRGKLQLVATAAMFVASKYEEIYPPDVGEFVYITDDTYTKKQVLRMEHLILKVLSFDLAVPTNLWFIQVYVRMCEGSDELLHLAMFLSELTLLDGEKYLRYLPSTIAASSVALARYTLQDDIWPEDLAEASGYSLNSLEGCLHDLHQTFAKADKYPQQAVREKYRESKWHEVSVFTPPASLPF